MSGTGKTSLSLGLAGYFGLELYLCRLPSIREDNELERLFTALPPRCIVLLEDIDAVGTKRRGHGPPELPKNDGENKNEEDSDDEDDKLFDSRSRCTLSGLLNVLDGVASQEGRIVLMTSNKPDKLDEALVRPGRIDKMISLGNISPRSAELMFLRMYAPDDTISSSIKLKATDGELEKQALEFSGHIPDNVITPAQLQGYLLNLRDSPSQAVSNACGWVLEEKMKLDENKR
jgi:chaperone BCS1